MVARSVPAILRLSISISETGFCYWACSRPREDARFLLCEHKIGVRLAQRLSAPRGPIFFAHFDVVGTIDSGDMRMELTIIGAGLAGSEAAWQAAERGVQVTLFEMRPATHTPVHATDQFAELVCSNSLGSLEPNRAPGVLKTELKQLGSLLLACAEAAAVPAGTALAVDRTLFAESVTRAIESHPKISVHRQEVTAVPPPPCPARGAAGGHHRHWPLDF